MKSSRHNPYLLVWTYILFVIFIFGCKKKPQEIEPEPEPAPSPVVIEVPKPSGPDVYISGTIKESDTTRAVIWKNDELVHLNSGYKYSEATGIVVRDTDTFVAGFINGSFGDSAVYWKNEKMTVLGKGRAFCIGISGNDVYVGGYSENGQERRLPTYWKNGQKITLEGSISSFDRPSDGIIKKILIAGGRVYATGYSEFDWGVRVATFWNDATATPLTPYFEGYDNFCPKSAGYDIANRSGELIIAGGIIPGTESFGKEGDPGGSVYWQNGKATALSTEEKYTQAKGIFVWHDTVYICGETEVQNYFVSGGAYWKNGKRFALLRNVFVPSSYSYKVTPEKIVVFDGKVYTVGNSTLDSNGNLDMITSYACYWINSQPVTLTSSGTVTDIAVVKKTN